MTDISATTFGLVIAYLLPGVAGFVSASYWVNYFRSLLKTFLQVESNVGLFLFVVLLSLVIGLQVSIVRWVIFEVVVARLFNISKLPDDAFDKLSEAGKLEAFTGAVNEHYRYHQFWGGMVVIIPVLALGWIWNQAVSATTNFPWEILLIGSIVAIEILTAMAAYVAYTARFTVVDPSYGNRRARRIPGHPGN